MAPVRAAPAAVPPKRRKTVEAQKACSKCHQLKMLTAFYRRYGDNEAYRSVCITCFTAERNGRRHTQNGFIRELIASSRGNANRRGHYGQHSLTVEAFHLSVKARQNRCYYLTLPLTAAPFSDWQLTLQRLDFGNYSMGNTVPASLETNNGAAWTRDKAVQLMTHTDDPMSSSEVEEIRKSVLQRQRQPQRRAIIAGGMARCFECGQWKALERMATCRKTVCQDCDAERRRNYRGTWAGAFSELLSSARKSTAARVKVGRTNQVFSVTIADLVDMLVSQRGVCSYSGKRMTPSGDWQASLERLSVDQGYIRSNCVLVIRELNGSDQRGRGHGDGSGGWSQSKYNFARENFDPSYYDRCPAPPGDMPWK